MQTPMRRGDKAITDRRQIDEIIRGSLVCRLALVQDGRPYLVPLERGCSGRPDARSCEPQS